ncbi:MAG: PAS domain-containing protein [Planctomycetes bacterium]|nr:PAS domain-containing protein [Planctomycetota bacterium]
MTGSRLSTRRFIVHGLLFVLAMLVFWFLARRVLETYSIDTARAEGLGRLRLLAGLLEIDPRGPRIETQGAEAWFGRQSRKGVSAYYRLLDPHGVPVLPAAEQGLPITDTELEQARHEGTGHRLVRREPATLFVAQRLEHEGRIIGFLHAAIPLREIEQERDRAAGGLVVAFLLVGGVGLGLFRILVRRDSRPVELLAEHTQLLVEGDYERQAPSWQPDEYRRLAENLDRLGQDLTARIKTGMRGQKNLETILASMVEGLVAVDLRHKVILMNEQAKALLGVEFDLSTSKLLSELTRSAELRDGIDEATRENRSVSREICPVGSNKVLAVHIAPLRDDERKVQGAVCVMHDVTRVRRLENMRRDFVANVSHELKTPLTAIQGAAETILDDAAMPEGVRKRFVERIIENARRLNSLINDVLELSRIQSSSDAMEHEVLDLGAIVRESVAQLVESAARREVKLCSETEPGRIKIRGDRRSLRSVIDNLVTNGVNYTRSGGEVRVHLVADGREARLTVQDNGIGIAKEHQERIFERFYRVDGARSRSQGGTGLGLAIVKNCVQAHRGTIRLDSELGKGSTFTVRFPLID